MFVNSRLYCVGSRGRDVNGGGFWSGSLSISRVVCSGGGEAPKDCSSGSCGRFH